jgi:hypothetical protein
MKIVQPVKVFSRIPRRIPPIAMPWWYKGYEKWYKEYIEWEIYTNRYNPSINIKTYRVNINMPQLQKAVETILQETLPKQSSARLVEMTIKVQEEKWI